MSLSIPQWLQQGMGAHRQGDLSQAERCYRQILSLQARHPDALHLLGVIALQRGEGRHAEKLINKAIKCNPRVVDYHNNLGEALRSQRRWSAARNAYRAALKLDPKHFQALNNLGLAQRELGLVADAEASFRAALAVRKDYFEAHFNLAQLLISRGDDAKAKPHLNEALALNANYPPLLLALANIHRRAQDYDDAIAFCNRLLTLNPRDAVALANRGECELQLARFGDAEQSLQHALTLNPKSAVVHNTYGVVLVEQDKSALAIGHFEQAIALDPQSLQARLNLAQTIREQREHDKALALYDALLADNPALGEARFGRSMIHLAAERWCQGWEDYEARFATAFQAPLQSPGTPCWKGERTSTLLLLVEQGFGDQLMIWRYLDKALALVDEVILQTPTPLMRLAETLSSQVRVVGADAQPEHNVHLPLMSLPHVLAVGDPAFGAAGYLTASSALRACWSQKLASLPAGKRVGVCWSGSALNPKNRKRQLGLEPLRSLFSLPGIQWISVQKEVSDADRQWLAEYVPSIYDPMVEVTDFADTAALLVGLDLVITLDSAVAHLAGALGVPCWTLVPFYHDWRWQLAGESSIWYDSLRLFRQENPEQDWAPVVSRLLGLLSA